MPSPDITSKGGNLIINGEVRGCSWLGGESLHDDPELTELIVRLLIREAILNPDILTSSPIVRNPVQTMEPNGLLDSPLFQTPDDLHTPSTPPTPAPQPIIPTPDPLFDGTIVDVYDGEVGITIQKMETPPHVGQSVRVSAA